MAAFYPLRSAVIRLSSPQQQVCRPKPWALWLGVVLGVLPRLGGAAAPEVDGQFSVGFDSFSEKFSIDEADTLDSTSEVRSQLVVGVGGELGEGHRYAVKNTFSLSEHVRRNVLRLGGDWRVRHRDVLSVENELAVKNFDGSDDFALSSDHVYEQLRVAYEAPLNDAVALTFRQVFETIDFEERSTYEYDYRRRYSRGGLKLRRSFETLLDVQYGYRTRVVPDSTSINYGEHLLTGNLLQLIGLAATLDVTGEMARRRYADSMTRPGHFLFDVRGGVGWQLSERFGARLRQELSAENYDIPSAVYFNRLQHLTGFEVGFDPNLEFRLAFEPRFNVLHADRAAGEEYVEYSLVSSGQWLKLDRLWMTASVELGARDYGFDDVDAIYSDYRFVRTHVMSTLEFGNRYAWSVFLVHEPERHRQENDNTTTTLFSTDVSLSF